MGRIRTTEEVGKLLFEQLDKAMSNPNDIFGYARYGNGEAWKQLDVMSGGMQEYNLQVLAARPKVGKSMWVSGIIPFVAEQAVEVDKIVRIVTLETTEEAYLMRIAAIMAKINDPMNIRRGKLTPEEATRYKKALKRLQSLPIEFLAIGRELEFEETMIPGNSGVTTNDVWDFVRGNRSREGETFWWVLDHAGLLKNVTQSKDVTSGIVSVIDSMTNLAHSVVTGMVITHLTRASVGGKVTLASLAGADQWGRNLDVGLLIERPMMDRELEPEDVALFDEGEPAFMHFFSRNENMGVIPMMWKHKQASFEELVLAPGVEIPMPVTKKAM